MAISNTELAQRISDLLDKWHSREDEMIGWINGTVSGGPNDNGTYPITDALGNTTYVDSPAKLEDLVNGPAGTAREYRDLAFDITHEAEDVQVTLGWDVKGVDTAANEFQIDGDQTAFLDSGQSIVISGSTGNDGTYSLASNASFDSGTGLTTVAVNEDVTDSTADGLLERTIGYSAYHYQQKAAASEDAAATSETNAADSEALAGDHAADANNYMNGAQAARDTSKDHRTTSDRYATETEDTTVVDADTGTDTGDYSALHHASKASTSASNAATSETNAADSETNAATYRDEAFDWSTAGVDVSLSDSGGNSGYSAYHHAEHARQAREDTEAYANGMKWQADVLAEQNDPPASPSSGDRYLIGPSPSGDWSDNAQDIATWDANNTVWDFASPSEGWSLNVNGSNLAGRTDVAMIFNGPTG